MREKYKTINGWTKERMKEQIRKGNNGKVSSIKRKVNYGVTCLYLTEDGNRSAVGCFIPDGHAGQKNGGGAYGLLADHPDLADVMPLVENALWELQLVHDYFNHTKGDVREALFTWIDENVEDAQ